MNTKIFLNKCRNILLPAALLVIWLIPFVSAAKPIIEGNIPFWYDPARDLLLAWDNLHKPTLVGPTSGIPGVFYGPHWVWWLSSGLVFSKDPRIVLFLTITLPYFVVIPAVLYFLGRRVWGLTVSIIVWLLFTLTFISYTNQIWSPNIADLLLFLQLGIFYLIGKGADSGKRVLAFFIMGIIQGFIGNSLVSFGVGTTIGWSLYFAIVTLGEIRNREKRIKNLTGAAAFMLGLIICLLPILFFEMRHGFMQTRSLLYTLNQGFVHDKAVVSQTGLSKQAVLYKFAERVAVALKLPLPFSPVSLPVMLIIFAYAAKRLDSNREKKHWWLLPTLILGLALVYLTARNPVWDYHFIAVELIYIFMLALILRGIVWLRKVIMVWMLLFFVLLAVNLVKSFFIDSQPSGLAAQKQVVDRIYADSYGRPFGYAAKNAAIYSFEYDYIFRWLGSERSNRPTDLESADTVYLIIPKDQIGDKVGFTDNRTPDAGYRTVKEWRGVDGTLVIKRMKK